MNKHNTYIVDVSERSKLLKDKGKDTNLPLMILDFFRSTLPTMVGESAVYNDKSLDVETPLGVPLTAKYKR